MAEYAVVVRGPIRVPSPFLRLGMTRGLKVPRSGPGYVAGTVTVEGVPASRPVRLYDRASGELVAETRSAAGDGSYRFNGVAVGREYLVMAYDDTNIHNAAPADRIEAVLAEGE
ncbi:MAG: hypothetical protein AB1578_07075 [Thermodesulfobacteriota bacterium]